MLVVRITGGLGNQMFQYAFARMLQQNGHKVFIHWHPHKTKSKHNGYELDTAFKLPLSNIIPISNNSFSRSLITWWMRKLMRRRDQHVFTYDSQYLDNKLAYLDGYWQTSQYFEPISHIIRKDFTFKPLSGSKNLELLERLSSQEHCSVHIRRGDYITHRDLGGICDEAYYRRALSMLAKRNHKCPLVVFSDDILYSKELLGDYKSAIFCDWNNGISSWMDMALMARCAHHIIANSTFSWWGAWLGNTNGTTIAPSLWTKNPNFKSTNIIPNNWTRL